jgi:hypothetical protein
MQFRPMCGHEVDGMYGSHKGQSSHLNYRQQIGCPQTKRFLNLTYLSCQSNS